MSYVYENIIRPILFKMEPEQAHDRGRAFLIALGNMPTLCALIRACNQVREENPVRLFGLKFQTVLDWQLVWIKMVSFREQWKQLDLVM